MGKEKCIILNKPFIGGYIDQSNENEAHELINFFLDDRGNHFIYCNPYGQNVSNAEKKEIKYLIFTSASKDKSFYIEYIVEIKKTLHNQPMPKAADRNKTKINERVESAKKEITENIKEFGYDNGLKDITYGNIPITELFTDSIKVIPITFLAKTIYKVVKPIKVGNSENGEDFFDYNFQRNFGYVSEKTKKPHAYNKLVSEIEKAIKGCNVEKISLSKFNINGVVGKIKPTFMDLISMYRQEECYTQILYKLFKYKKENIKEFLEFAKKKGDLPKSPTEDLDIKAEYAIEKVGRLDLYAFNDNENFIIENKVDSGINYVKRENEQVDQLTRYYDYFEGLNPKKNTYILLAPNEKVSYLKAEVNNLNTKQAVKDAYHVVGYKTIYGFFYEKAQEVKLSKFEYSHCIDDIIEIFKRLSLSRREMCEENLLNNIQKKKTNP